MSNAKNGNNQSFLIYQDDNGISNVTVRFEGEDVWLTAEQLQTLFQASQQDVSHHIQQIYDDGELVREATHKKYLLVRTEGNRSVKRQISHYNLDMILAIGMRIRSEVAVRFRQWAIRHLHEFAVKGFTLDGMLTLSGRELLSGKGYVSHEEACRKAVAEFREYRRREMLQYESDFDRAVRELTQKSNLDSSSSKS